MAYVTDDALMLAREHPVSGRLPLVCRKHDAVTARARHPHVRAVLLVVALALAPAANAPGQQARPVRLELRTDAFFARRPTVQAGVGVAVRATRSLRVAGIVAAGGTSTAEGAQPAARGELVARFALDPLEEHRWGMYGAAGVGAFWDDERAWRGRLVLGVGVERRSRDAWSPAFEVGIGEGFRIGVVLRNRR